MEQGLWDRFSQKLDLDARKEVRLEVIPGGIQAKPMIPVEEIQEIEQKEDPVFTFTTDFGIAVKQYILSTVDDLMHENSSKLDYNIYRIIVTPDSGLTICVHFTSKTRTEWIFQDLSEALVESKDIEDSSELAYGSITQVHENTNPDSELYEGWRFDGTLYKYTQTPYDYWKSSSEESYPENMKEWAEFASDSKEEEQFILNKDKHVVHFHPSKYNLSALHPLIQWWHKVEEYSKDQYSFNTESSIDVSLSQVVTDPVESKLVLSVTVQEEHIDVTV